MLRVALLPLLLFLLTISHAQERSTQVNDYVLGPEDTISIAVLRHPEFSDDYLVPQSGLLQIKAVGEVRVTGMSLDALQKHVLHKLRDRLRNPEVSIQLKTARMRRIYVLGEVKAPGVFDLKDDWGIQESLSAAGGIAAGVQSRDCTIVLERAEGGKRLRLPLDQALGGPLKDNLTLMPGDVLRVEAIATLPVYVTGKVKKPGVVRLREDAAGLLEAIAQAEGVTDGAAVAAIRIIHVTGQEETIDLSSILARDSVQIGGVAEKTPIAAKLPRLFAGDIVLVPESLERFAILGYVTKPGFYSIPSGRKYTLAEALAAAEGADKRGRISRIGLVRVENGKEVRRIFDLGKYLRSGDVKQNPEIVSGDVLYVPETNRVDLATVLSGVSSTALFFNAIRR